MTGVAAGMVVEMVMVGVATLTTAAEEATAVEEGRQVAAVTRDAVTRDTARISSEVTAVADAVSGEVVGDDGTVLGVAALITVQPGARLLCQVRTTDTSRWRLNTGVERRRGGSLWPEGF